MAEFINKIKQFFKNIFNINKEVNEINQQKDRENTYTKINADEDYWNQYDELIDMKLPNSFWLRSPKAKHSKKGTTYIVIPFRKKVKEMPSAVYQEMRKKETGEKLTEKSDAGQRLILKFGKDIFKKIKETHKTSPFEGLTKVKRINLNKSHQYISFRTLSTASPQGSWIISKDALRRALNNLAKGNKTALKGLMT